MSLTMPASILHFSSPLRQPAVVVVGIPSVVAGIPEEVLVDNILAVEGRHILLVGILLVRN